MLSELTVSRTQVLDILKTNRDEHVTAYEKACSGYSLAIEHEFARVKRAAGRAAELVAAGKAPKWNTVHFDPSLVRPVSHAPEYDCAIRMLELSIDNHLQLEAQQFKCYVMDDWVWKAQVTQSYGTYAAYSTSSTYWIR